MANNKLTIKEAILKALEEQKKALTYNEVFNIIKEKNLYDFGDAKTPKETVSALLGDFIRDNDLRIKRVKQKNIFIYYLSKSESEITFDTLSEEDAENQNHNFNERDLHPLLSSFCNNESIATKTIYHEKSQNSKDSHQKWIHPDMVGVQFLTLKNKPSHSLLKITNQSDTYKIYSYELKKEINTDYDLKKSYFQAVSNSSWANYGYLVAFMIADNLMNEIERLNESFGIGIIELKANPFKSKILYPAKHKKLDFKTIDKLCEINENFRNFIEGIEKLLTASEKFIKATKFEFLKNCDETMNKDSAIKEYCKEKNIPYDDTEKTK